MSQINEQIADYQLADLSPALKAANSGNTLLENLPVWLSAQTRKSAGRGRSASNTLQYGVQKLRELILELAVRGKLVPQDSNDEPASILLEKIAEEKARLVREGKIKKQKPLPEIAPSEVFLDEPAGWQSVRLGDIVQIIRGITFPASEKSKTPEDGRVACLRTTNVQQNIEWDDLLFISESFISRNEQYIQPQDIVMSMANSRELVGKVALVDSKPDMPVTFGGFLGVIRPIQLNPMFLMIALRTPQIKNELIGSASQTTNIANISIGKLNPMVFPVPPLPEQHRIVKKVDELMALCDQLEQQQADAVQAHDTLVKVLLDTLIQSETAEDFQQNWQRLAAHFDTLFTTESSIDQLKQTLLQLAVMGKLVPQDPNDGPASELLKILREEKKQLVNRKQAKDSGKLHQKAPSVPPYDLPSKWNWVRFRELIHCYRGHNPPKSEFASEPRPGYVRFIQITDFKTDANAVYVPDSSRNKMIYKGEIIMAAYRHVGKLSRAMEGAFNVALCKVMEFAPLNRDYIELLIGTDLVKGELLRASERGHIPSMHSDHLLSLLVPLPPLAEQHRIVQKVDELMALCDQLKVRLIQAQTLQQKLADTVINEALR